MRSFFGSRLSENMTRTHEGYLIAHRVPIARTGWQDYFGGEIDPDNMHGLDRTRTYRVLREPEQVFDLHTIASFEGKTFTLSHPRQHLTAKTDADHNMGHVQHVERGDDLANGDQVLIADIVIKHPDALRAVDNGVRDISCGYTSQYEPIGDSGDFRQTQITGNHIALVDKGRAGKDVRINDHTPAPTERFPVAKLNDLITLGLFHKAKEATTPDELMRAVKLIPVSDAEPDETEKPSEKAPEKETRDADAEGSDTKLDRIIALLEKMTAPKADDEEMIPEEATDDEEPEGTIVLTPEERGENPFATGDALAKHLSLKKIVAASNDSAAKTAWNETFQRLKGKTPSNDSYVKVIEASKTKAESVDVSDSFALATQLSTSSRSKFRAKQ